MLHSVSNYSENYHSNISDAKSRETALRESLGNQALSHYFNSNKNRISITPQQSIFEDRDRIHQPMINQYRSITEQPDGGTAPVNGVRIGSPDSLLKYSGILGRMGGGARWLRPVVNRRNAAEVYFNSTPLIDPPGGLTTQFINGQSIHSNLDVESAIPEPQVRSRTENNRTYCWFTRGVSVTGGTTMDIFSEGPWTYEITGAQAHQKYASSNCQNRAQTTIRVRGRPSDRALEEYLRLGELEHEVDSRQAFMENIGAYARNVAQLVGDTPYTRLRGPDRRTCEGNLHRLSDRSTLLTKFVLDLNRFTAGRHAGGRHSASITGVRIRRNCSRIIVDMQSGNL